MSKTISVLTSTNPKLVLHGHKRSKTAKNSNFFCRSTCFGHFWWKGPYIFAQQCHYRKQDSICVQKDAQLKYMCSRKWFKLPNTKSNTAIFVLLPQFPITCGKKKTQLFSRNNATFVIETHFHTRNASYSIFIELSRGFLNG